MSKYNLISKGLKQHLILIILLVVHNSCTNTNSTSSCNQVFFNKEVSSFIEDYISKNESFNTFVMREVLEQTIDDVKINNGFILGPVYQNMLTTREQSVYFTEKGKRIYFVSNLSFIVDSVQDDNKWHINDQQDSIDIDGIIIKDKWVLSMKKSVYLYFNENSQLLLNNRADTIFLPKYIKNKSIKFEYKQSIY